MSARSAKPREGRRCVFPWHSLRPAFPGLSAAHRLAIPTLPQSSTLQSKRRPRRAAEYIEMCSFDAADPGSLNGSRNLFGFRASESALGTAIGRSIGTLRQAISPAWTCSRRANTRRGPFMRRVRTVASPVGVRARIVPDSRSNSKCRCQPSNEGSKSRGLNNRRTWPL